MFVYSLKTTKKRLGILFGAVVVAAAVTVLLVMRGGKSPASTSSLSLKANSASERLAFISQFGWEVYEDPTQVTEVIIPAEFDEVYTEYASMQKEQGFDLEPYKGLRAKRWTYSVLNYPGYEDKEGTVEINLLIYDGIVIGGDVCSLELGGFMHGFDFPENDNPAAPAKTNT